jgi:glycyl-tRNA synthetase (class II)
MSIVITAIEKDGTVTLRYRDSGEQERKTIEEVVEIIRTSLK